MPVLDVLGRLGGCEPLPNLEVRGSLRFRLIDKLHMKDQQAFCFSRCRGACLAGRSEMLEQKSCGTGMVL